MKTQNYFMSGIRVLGKARVKEGKEEEECVELILCAKQFIHTHTHTHTHTQSLSTNPFEVRTWDLTSPSEQPRPRGARSLPLWSKSTWAAALGSELSSV